MTSSSEKKYIHDGKALPRVYADQFCQISYGAAISKVTLALESGDEIRPFMELAMPTENFISGVKFMMESYSNQDLKKVMIDDLERLLATLKE